MAFASAAALRNRSARARSWIWRMGFLGLAALWVWDILPEGSRGDGLTWKVTAAQLTDTSVPPIANEPVAPVGMGSAADLKTYSKSSIPGIVDKVSLPIWWGVAGILAAMHMLKVLAGGAWLRRNSSRVAGSQSVKCDVEVRSSDKIDAPLLAGLFHTAIYVPQAAEGWTEAKWRDVFRHESAHYSRGDLWWQFGGAIIGSFWWGNPLVWIALRALKVEAEEAADDAVVQQDTSAEGYARLLVEMASGPARPASTGISMLGHSSLEKRIRVILAGNPLRGTIGASGAALLCSLAAFIILCLSAGIVLAEVDLTNGQGEVVHYQADPAKTELPQGNFRVTGGTLKEWIGETGQASSPQRGLVRLKAGDHPVSIDTQVVVAPSWKWLTVIARTRPGGEGKFSENQQGEIAFTPEDADGKPTGAEVLLTDARREGYTNWTSPMRTFAVPNGTAKLKVSMRVTPGATAFDCSEIFVIPSSPENELDHRLVDRFFDAVKANDGATVESMLKAEPKLANSRRGSQDNGTPLTLCAWKELPEMAAILIENGAILESTDTGAWRSTPLTWCGWWGSPKTAKVLLDAGANPKFTSAFGVTPLSSAKAGKGANGFSQSSQENFDKVIAMFTEAQK